MVQLKSNAQSAVASSVDATNAVVNKIATINESFYASCL